MELRLQHNINNTIRANLKFDKKYRRRKALTGIRTVFTVKNPRFTYKYHFSVDFPETWEYNEIGLRMGYAEYFDCIMKEQ